VGRLARVFLFQAEDGIRAFHVTGVQTCALPIYHPLAGSEVRQRRARDPGEADLPPEHPTVQDLPRRACRLEVAGLIGDIAARREIGRASCRERAELATGTGATTKAAARREIAHW